MKRSDWFNLSKYLDSIPPACSRNWTLHAVVVDALINFGRRKREKKERFATAQRLVSIQLSHWEMHIHLNERTYIGIQSPTHSIIDAPHHRRSSPRAPNMLFVCVEYMHACVYVVSQIYYTFVQASTTTATRQHCLCLLADEPASQLCLACRMPCW